MTTGGTRFDLPCLFQHPGGCDAQLPSGPTSITVETMTSLLVDGGVFPIDLHFNLPKITLDMSRTLHSEAEVYNKSSALPESEWVSVASLVLAEGSYSIDSTSGEMFHVIDNPSLPAVELKLNEFVTMQRTRVDNVRTALDTIDYHNNGKEVTLRIRTAPDDGSLLDSIVSKLEFILPFTKNMTEEGTKVNTSAASNGYENALRQVRGLSLDITSALESVTVQADVKFEMPELPSGMNITVAGGNFSLYSEGVKGTQVSTAGSARDALDYCAVASNEGAPRCHAANISWPETVFGSQQLASLSFRSVLFSSGSNTDGDIGKLLGQMTSAALAGEANVLSVEGHMYSTDVPTHANLSLGQWHTGERYVVPVNAEVVMLHIARGGDAADDSESGSAAAAGSSSSSSSTAQERIDKEVGPLQRVNLDSISSRDGNSLQSLDLPCMLGSDIPRCINQAPQSISVTTTVFLALHRSLPLNDMDIVISVPKLDVAVFVIFTPTDGTSAPPSSDSPMAQLGLAKLDGFGFDGQSSNTTIGITTTGTLVNSNTVRELRTKIDEDVYNITYVLKGKDPNEGTGKQSTLLQKLMRHLEYRVTVSPTDTSSSLSSSVAAVERKSVVQVIAGPQPSVVDGVQASARLKLHPFDLPEWLPPVTCAGFSADLHTDVADDGSGGSKAASLTLGAFTMNASLPADTLALDAAPGD